jgi:hypothetical protein
LALNLLVQFGKYIHLIKCGKLLNWSSHRKWCLSQLNVATSTNSTAQALTTGFGKVWTALRGWFSDAMNLRAAGPEATAAIPVRRPSNTHPQSSSMQWSKIAAVMNGAIGSAALAGQLQRSASQQLDAAGYALDILRSELTAAMTLPSDRSAPSVVLQMPRSLVRASRVRSQLAA